MQQQREQLKEQQKEKSRQYRLYRLNNAEKLIDYRLNNTEKIKQYYLNSRDRRFGYDPNYQIDIVPRNYNNLAVRQAHLFPNETDLITFDQFRQLYNDSNLICALSGVLLNSQPHSAFQWSPDRIDPFKGYVLGNIRIVALELNVCPTYTVDILQEYVQRSIKDIERSSNELNEIINSDLFKKKFKNVIKYASAHVREMRTKTTLSRRQPDENGSLMTIESSDIHLMFMEQKGRCYYTNISIYNSFRL